MHVHVVDIGFTASNDGHWCGKEGALNTSTHTTALFPYDMLSMLSMHHDHRSMTWVNIRDGRCACGASYAHLLSCLLHPRSRVGCVQPPLSSSPLLSSALGLSLHPHTHVSSPAMPSSPPTLLPFGSSTASILYSNTRYFLGVIRSIMTASPTGMEQKQVWRQGMAWHGVAWTWTCRIM